jgi:uncharacterized protein (TIGR00661 family)
MANLRIIFAVQGEGRGHLTQALTLFKTLSDQGHIISAVIVGRNPSRDLPDFFLRKINVPVIQVESPNFSMGNSGRSVSMLKTLASNFSKWKIYGRSLERMKEVMDHFQPHLVINFYEPLIALYTLRYVRDFKIISIAHQYIYLHQHFRFPQGFPFQAMMLKAYTKFTALGSQKILALSMYNLNGKGDSRLIVTPPALRNELFNRKTSDENFILVYLVNSGFMTDIIQWHKKYPNVKLVCFTDSRDVKDRYKGCYKIDDTLIFHSLNDEKFMDMMSRCSALVCTAGFESVCEAMYLGKPTVLVPVEGHFEQFCNAMDAQRIGAGIYSRKFDLNLLNRKLMIPYTSDAYKEWVHSFSVVLNKVINEQQVSLSIPSFKKAIG